MIIPESYIAHGLFGRGEERANHKYVARIPTGKNSYRYFYSAAEYKAYKMGKSVGNRVDKMKDQTSKTIQAYNNKVRAAAGKTGSQVSKFANRTQKNINKSMDKASAKISDVLKDARKGLDDLHDQLTNHEVVQTHWDLPGGERGAKLYLGKDTINSKHPERNKHEGPSEYMKLVNRMNQINPQAKEVATAGQKLNKLLSNPRKLAKAIREDPEGVAKLVADADIAAGTFDNYWSYASNPRLVDKNTKAVTGLNTDEISEATKKAARRNSLTSKGQQANHDFAKEVAWLSDIANNEAMSRAVSRDYENEQRGAEIRKLQSDAEYYQSAADMFGRNPNNWPAGTRKEYERWLEENREDLRKYGIDVP